MKLDIFVSVVAPMSNDSGIIEKFVTDLVEVYVVSPYGTTLADF